MNRDSPTHPGSPSISIGPGQRVLLVDDRLRDARGHQLGFVRGMASWLAAAGAEVEVWAHRDLDPALALPGTVWRRIFSIGWQESFLRHGRRTRALGVLLHNLRFLFQAQRSGWTRRRDLVIATEASIFHLLAWNLWLRLAPRRSRLLLVFVQPPWMLDYAADDGSARPKRQAVLYRWMLRLMSGDFRLGRCRLAADSVAVAGYLRDGGRWPVADIMVPASEELRGRLDSPPRSHAGVVRLGVLGRPVRDRGFGRILAAIEIFCGGPAGEAAPAIEFVVQWHADREARDDDRQRLERLAADFPAHVRIVDTAMDDAAYADLIVSLHGGIVTYDRSAYANRASSVAMQLLNAGRPFITTAGTWMAAEQSLCGAGVTCGESPAEIAAAFATFAASYDTLATQAWVRRGDARRRYSWPEFFARTGIDLDQRPSV